MKPVRVKLTSNGLDLGKLEELSGSLNVEVGDTEVLDETLVDELPISLVPGITKENELTSSMAFQVGETSSQSSRSRSFLPDLPLMVCSWVGRTPSGASTWRLI